MLASCKSGGWCREEARKGGWGVCGLLRIAGQNAGERRSLFAAEVIIDEDLDSCSGRGDGWAPWNFRDRLSASFSHGVNSLLGSKRRALGTAQIYSSSDGLLIVACLGRVRKVLLVPSFRLQGTLGEHMPRPSTRTTPAKGNQ